MKADTILGRFPFGLGRISQSFVTEKQRRRNAHTDSKTLSNDAPLTRSARGDKGCCYQILIKNSLTLAPMVIGAVYARLGYVALQGATVLALLVFGTLGIEKVVA